MKAEALRELEEVTEFLRKSPRRSRGGAERCVEAVGKAIRRLYRHLCGAMDGAGMPHPVLQAFGRHLNEYLLLPSGRGGGRGGARLASAPGRCFTYEPPATVVWESQVSSLESEVQSPASAECGVRNAKWEGRRAPPERACPQAQQHPNE